MPSFQRFVQNMTGITPDPLLADPDLVSHLLTAVLPFILTDPLRP